MLGAVSGGVFFILALVVWWRIFAVNRRAAARLSARRRRLLKAVIALIVVCGLGVGTAVFFYEQRIRTTTVYEAMLPGTLGLAPGDDAPVSVFRIPVVHPGVPHSLFFSPVDNSLKGPGHPVRVAVRVEAPAGEVLVEQETTFEPEVSNVRRGKTAWPGYDLVFTPSVPGDHRVEITPLGTGIAALHVLVNDPLKRDGRRLKGY